jgi:ATP-dependent DNA helicase DinG
MLQSNRLKAHQDIETIFRTLLPRNGMAVREGQIELCHSTLDAMAGNKIELSDAGVGIGKTFAYLTAGALFSIYAEDDMPKPILISTSSVALQNAVLTIYIPFLSDVLLEGGIIDKPFEAVLRKGKSRHVCDDRLAKRIMRVNRGRKNPDDMRALLSLRNTLDLDKAAHLSGYDRGQVCVPAVCDCRLPSCRYRQFVQESKSPRYLFQVCNHNFLIADSIHRDREIAPLLPDCRAIIIDEAHKLPEAARQMFGKTLCQADIAGLIAGLQTERFILAAQNLNRAFKPILTELAGLKESDEDVWEYPITGVRTKAFSHALATVSSIHKVLQRDVTQPLKNQLADLADTLRLFKERKAGWIFYAARNRDGEAKLTATVASLEGKMRDTLWNRPLPMILTSGTLAVGQDFSRFREEAGLGRSTPRIVESVSLSPFDYQKNCLLYFPDDVSVSPEDGESTYYAQIARQVAGLIQASHGHTLVLFTAYTSMSSVHEQVRQIVTDYPLFAMSRGGFSMPERFRASGNGVLFAAGTVWEGMDFPGDIVSLLIIVRLPFAVPDPLSDHKKQQYPSLKAFLQAVVVPDMQIRLKQGFGRAIRTETDTCVIAVLDERARKGQRYHQAVLDALPDMPMTENLSDVEQFIREVKQEDYFAKEARP